MEIDFEKYDRENPKIWEMFVYYAKKAKAKGFTNYGSKGIFELIRWHTGIKGNDKFKINNNYTADYARKMEAEYPTFKGFFRMKNLISPRVETGKKQQRKWTF